MPSRIISMHFPTPSNEIHVMKKKAAISHIKHCLSPPFHLEKHFILKITVESYKQRSSTLVISFPSGDIL